jgi:hypothetical protein
MVEGIFVEGVPIETYRKNMILNDMALEAKLDHTLTQCEIKKSIHKTISEKLKPEPLPNGKVKNLTFLEILTLKGRENVLMSTTLVGQILELVSRVGKLPIRSIADHLNLPPRVIGQQMRWMISKVGSKFNNVGPNKEYGFVNPETKWEDVLKEYNDSNGKKNKPTTKLIRRTPEQISAAKENLKESSMKDDVLKLLRQIDFLLDHSNLDPTVLELIQLAGESFWKKWK